MSEPLDPEEVLERHAPMYNPAPSPDQPECLSCYGGVPWPCDAAQLARQLLAAQERVAALEGALKWIAETDPALGSWDGWRFVQQIRDYARALAKPLDVTP